MTRSGGRRLAVLIAVGGAAALTPGIAQNAHAIAPLAFAPAFKLPTPDAGTEPRATVTPDGHHFVVTNKSGTMVVYESDDGVTNWHQTAADPVGQQLPTIDVDIVATASGRLIASELDTAGLNFVTSYSDDQGAHWTASSGIGPFSGTGFADQDRQWLAVGPHNHVYMLFHNLGSGTVSHNMYVMTSTDNGATWPTPPIPVTNPGTASPTPTGGSQAWQDLQCADSGGPSNLIVNQNNGRVYAVWGTRSAPVGGGCLASVTGSFQVNVVAATRIWISTAPEETGTGTGTLSPAQWTNSLAVDDNTAGQIVGMQLAPGAIDSANNFYVLYPESLHQYPDYSGAAIKYVHASEANILANPYGLLPPVANPWAAPVTVAQPGTAIAAGQPGDAGHLLPHIVAGGPGELDVAYFTGDTAGATAGKANWFMTASQVTNALSATPTITPEIRLSNLAMYQNEHASDMMGACRSGPTGALNGFTCNRSTDVWGIALDKSGNVLLTWPGVGPNAGTYVTEQIAGPTVNVAETPWAALLLLPGAGLATAWALGRRRRTP